MKIGKRSLSGISLEGVLFVYLMHQAPTIHQDLCSTENVKEVHTMCSKGKLAEKENRAHVGKCKLSSTWNKYRRAAQKEIRRVSRGTTIRRT